VLAACLALSAFGEISASTYEIWEPEPAPNNGRSNWEHTKSLDRHNSYDQDWERWSYPLGNGYVGACVFGRTDTERIQITDKTVHNRGKYKKGGLTSFAEIYLDFNQDDVRNLNSIASVDPTHLLLEKYKAGETNTWLEELMFQYGRYLLIASSREKSLPANLQGTWSQDYYTPWTGGYWHDINVQMNYWGAMSANLAECFEAYIAFFNAYLPLTRQHATDYVREHNPDRLTEGGDNGWVIGTGANAYYIPGAGASHSGPGNRARRRKMQNESGTPTPSGRSRVIGCSLRMEPDGKSGFAEQHTYVQAAVHQGDHMAIRIDVCPCKGGPSGAILVFGNIPRIIDRLQRQR
jgi:hypothetical protein